MGLFFYCSAMNGGKTTLLLQNAHSIRSRGYQALVIGYRENTRDQGITSRLGVSTAVDIFFDKDTELSKEIKAWWQSNDKPKLLEILVDEAQFLTPLQVEELLCFSLEANIDVKCYGLKTNFKTKAFAGSRRLLELAEVTELSLVRCKCGGSAKINARFNSATGELVTHGKEEIIESSSEKYIYDPLCYKCYLSLGGNFTPISNS